jgi:hypothetical protein
VLPKKVVVDSPPVPHRLQDRVRTTTRYHALHLVRFFCESNEFVLGTIWRPALWKRDKTFVRIQCDTPIGEVDLEGGSRELCDN